MATVRGEVAHDALAATRKRCWNQDWVLDLDIRAFFDSVPHGLLLKAVAHHTDGGGSSSTSNGGSKPPCNGRTAP